MAEDSEIQPVEVHHPSKKVEEFRERNDQLVSAELQGLINKNPDSPILTLHKWARDKVAAFRRREKQRDTIHSLEQRSRIDDKNENILNEEGFKEALIRAINHAERTGEPLSAALFDLSGFKQVNDVIGHAAGDLVLRFVGDFYKDNLRPQDIIARLHGDEFALAFPDSTSESIRARLEELREAELPNYINRRLKEEGIKQATYVTTSMGFADYQTSDTPESMLERADQDMYEDKRNGGRGR